MVGRFATSAALAAFLLCIGCRPLPDIPRAGYLAYLDRPPTETHLRAAESSGADFVLPIRLVDGVYIWGPASESFIRYTVPDVSRVEALDGHRLPLVEVWVRTVDSATAGDVAWMRGVNAHFASVAQGDTVVAAVFRIDSIDALLANPRFVHFVLLPISVFLGEHRTALPTH